MEQAQLTQSLFDDYQYTFPLSERPFDNIARRIGVGEAELIKHVKWLMEKGVISRIGPVFRADSVSINRLMSMSVPNEDLERVASVICLFDEVTHCYERTHLFNLWFVVSEHSEKAIESVLSRIEKTLYYKPVQLPVLHDYHINFCHRLNSTVSSGNTAGNVVSIKATSSLSSCLEATEAEQKLIQLIHRGIPVCESPYRILGNHLGMSGRDVIGLIRIMFHHNIFRRWGVVFRFYEMGYHSRAMVVWDVPNDEVDNVALNIAGTKFVSACFKRPRCLPSWHYNLFTEVHGKTALSISVEVEAIVSRFALQKLRYCVLFSGRRFKDPGMKRCVVKARLSIAPENYTE